MQFMHHILRRPGLLLAMTVALIAMLAGIACGSAAQSEPVATPAAAASVTAGDNAGQAGPGGSQPAQSDHHSQSDTDASGSGNHHTTGGDGMQSGAVQSDDIVINMGILARETDLPREDLQVKRGDTVSINFTADEPGEIHLHGYNLTAAVAPDSPGVLTFVAETAGSFGINFHVFAPEGVESGDPHTAMAHGPVESEVPVSINFTADVEADGSVNIRITTDGWRWAPEEVNQEDAPGVGHAHIYVDGEKITRVYGPDFHLIGLQAGEHEIRVNLNTNQHSELLVQGRALEKTITVIIPEAEGMAAFPAAQIWASEAMSLDIVAHPDSLGGYNLQLITSGFAFAPGLVHQAHVDGKGYGLLFIDGAYRFRIYSDWVQLSSLSPGTHEIQAVLVSNDGIAYFRNDQQVAATITVTEAEHESEAGSNHGNTGNAHSHETPREREVIAEVHLGNLEVYP